MGIGFRHADPRTSAAATECASNRRLTNLCRLGVYFERDENVMLVDAYVR